MDDLTGYLDLHNNELVLAYDQQIGIACPECIEVNTIADPASSFDSAAGPDDWVCARGHLFVIELYNRKGSPTLRVLARQNAVVL